MANFLGLLTFAACIFLSNAKCRDTHRDCQKLASKCYSPDWINFMKANCQWTCISHCSNGNGGGSGSGGNGNGGNGNSGGGGGGSGSGKCGRSSVQQGRIVAGVNAKPGAWPWMVSLNIKGQPSHFCGGSLISPNWVLTASHCTDTHKASGIDVIIGEHNRQKSEGNEQRINVKRIIIHETYLAQKDLKYDVSLLELERPARINSRSQVICLPAQGYKPRVGTKCYLAGWGTTSYPGETAQVLQQAMLPIVDDKRCTNADGFVCAGYGRNSKINACQGDSGGPLMCQESDGRWVQQGVTSFVVELCKYYTAFAQVGNHRDWIKKHTGV